MKQFGTFLVDGNTLLSTINKSTIEMFKVARQKSIQGLKQSRGGSSIALLIANLHPVFKFALVKKTMGQKTINQKNESKPRAESLKWAPEFIPYLYSKLLETAAL